MPLGPDAPAGLKFDSEKEAKRWLVLLGLLKAREISHLARQCRVRVIVNGIHVCSWVADFTYIERGNRVYEDVKSPITRRLPVYVLKRKLVKATLGITIRET